MLRPARPRDNTIFIPHFAVVKANDGNKVHAAEQLKIGTATLYRKLKPYEATKNGW